MPCFDAETARENAENREEIPRLHERIHNLTRLLCEAGKVVVVGKNPSPELMQYWTEHAKQDADRGESWFK